MIISTSGKKGSGKDTIAKIIQYHTAKHPFTLSLEEYLKQDWLINSPNNNYHIKKFASKLKEIVSILTGIPVEDFEKEEVKQRKLEEWKIWKVMFDTNHNDIDHTIVKDFLTEDEARDYCDENYIVGFTLIEFTPDVRFLLQYIGTDLFRKQLHSNIWVNALFSEYRPVRMPSSFPPPETDKEWNDQVYPYWIITDTRFPNELKAIQDKDGLTLRVYRPETDKLAGNHESETALDDRTDWDWIIDNTGDLKYLEKEVKSFLKYYKLYLNE